jgi:LysM repeat protein
MYLWGVRIMNENYNNAKIYLEELESLPKNVRQIGDAREGGRIYMEDYVNSYIHQFAMDKKTSEQIALLVGKYYTYNDEVVVIIEGAIKGEHTEKVNGDLCITERTWYYAYEKIRKYFEDYNIVGWMYTQPGYGILLTSFLKEHHKKNFIDDKQILYIVDPLEKEDSFFTNIEGELKEKKGYYIYYDKNPSMHNYMLEHKTEREDKNEEDIDLNNDIIRTFRRKEQQRKDDVYQKKFINMLSILCGGLVLVCLIMGIGLLHNIEKLNELQSSMSTMTKKYNNIKKEADNINNLKINSNDQLAPTKNIEDNLNNSDQKNNNTSSNNISTTKPIVTGKVPEKYEVQVGDSLNTISEKFYNTLDMVPVIQELNGISNKHKIYIGQKILLPRP